MAVPPRGFVDLVYEISVKKPGPFEIGVNLFINDGGTRCVELEIRGVGVGSKNVNHEQVGP